jgi:predicted metal-dependent enzyme (double-stranded beta helix superfamily)
MCDFHGHDRSPEKPYGFIVDTPGIRALIAETRRLMRDVAEDRARVEQLRPAFATLLAAEGWLPDEYAQPDFTSNMGGGIGQYALYRAEDGSLCLFALVVPAGARTPVHDHLAWGLIGIYRGRQHETIYRRLDAGEMAGRARLEVKQQQTLGAGQFYALLPPEDDIHYVETVSETPSISIHLLANDTACVWRHRFDPDLEVVTAFRSGYSNAPCPPEAAPPADPR